MSSRVILLGALGILVAGYVFYGRLVSRILGVDPDRKTPAHTSYDGVDYVPARHWLVLFGHHFSSICAAGPIVGPAVAVAYWGWAPSLAWILVGGVLLGAVADFTSLVVAIRHGGVSISEVTAQVVTPRARLFFSIFIFLALILVLAVFSAITAQTFLSAPEIVIPSFGILPVAVLAGLLLYRGRQTRGRLGLVTAGGLACLVVMMVIGHDNPINWGIGASGWIWILLAYCFLAAVLPVQFLLQPRDYLSSYVLFFTIACGVAAAVAWPQPMSAAGFHAFDPPDWPTAGPLFPLLFVTIACGAISGFHSVVSSGTTCKQISSEAHACRIGYGAMLLESLVAVLVLVAVGAGIPAGQYAGILRAGGGGPIVAFGQGYGSITEHLFGGYGRTFAVMALNFFILTTLDTATRLARYLLQELLHVGNRYLPTLVVVGLTAPLALTGQWRTIWPVFGASNQLVGGLALLVTSLWLLQRGRKTITTLVPAVVMLVVTIGALGVQIRDAARGDYAQTGTGGIIAAIDIVLVVLALFVLYEAWGVLRKTRHKAAAPAAP
jgi:carbon starvation protein